MPGRTNNFFVHPLELVIRCPNCRFHGMNQKGFKRKPHIFFFWRFQWNFNSISAVSRFFGVQKLKLKVVSLKPRVSTEMEAEGLLLSRIPLVSMNTTQPPSQLNTFGFNEIHLPSFSVEYPWFQWNVPLFFNFWYPKNRETADILLKFRWIPS